MGGCIGPVIVIKTYLNVELSTNICKPHEWRNGKHVRLECSRSWIQALVGLNQRLHIWYFLLIR